MAEKKKAKDKGLTPMMQQFATLKEKHPDAMLLFRCGDFYETYMDDAVEASRILGITLTRRSNGRSNGADTEMAGFPHHALDTYLPKLIRAGRRVAICDQLEDPKLTKTLVKRGITELVTPGVAMGDNVLNYKENNFLAAVHFGRTAVGVAFLDISTGEFLTGEGTADYVEKLMASIQPKEVLYDRAEKTAFEQRFGTRWCVFELDDWMFTEQSARQKLLRHFGTATLKGFGVDHLHSGVVAAGVILQYLEMTQHTHIGHITSLARIDEERYVRLDNFTIRSLELVRAMQDDGVSLLDVVDRTVTPMGGRMLRRWLVFPLRDAARIERRLDVVDHFRYATAMKEAIDTQMHLIGDIERIISKVAVGRVTPREVVQLRTALQALVPIRQACLEADCEALRSLGERINPCDTIRDRIGRELNEDAPQVVGRGGVIAPGFSAELDELRDISRGGRDYLLRIQEREIEQTGIASLKVGYNNVFGYYLEVRNTYRDRVPQEWVRKQTLAQAERYITAELKEYEEKIMGADEKILALETRLFGELVTALQEYIPQVQTDASIVAQIDCLLSYAKAADEHGYVRPTVDDSETIDIKEGRHPVIETQLPTGEEYVPNDITLDSDTQQIMIITGPNMAGKSALLRQTALIVLMAQTGCFVPAQSARIGLVDKIFTRVGASDNISLGESTFMVEMTEAANILNNVTPRSLVLFDELGRGTSTYDGISIAWAIVEYLHEQRKARARTLFATHYHELNEMERHFARISNYNVSVREDGGRVIFLRKLMPGGSEHSFGIHVADIAGMPKSIVRRAEVILRQLEADNADVGTAGTAAAKPHTERLQPVGGDGMQLSFFQLDDPVLCQVRDEILGLDIDNLTPVEALNKLNDIKRIVSGKH